MTDTTSSEYVGDFAQLLKIRAQLQKDSDLLNEIKENAIAPIKEKIAALRTDLERELKRFTEREDKLYSEMAQVTAQLRDQWKENPKTQYVDGCVLRRRDTKELDIVDEDALLDQLVKIGKLKGSVLKYDEKRLIALAEVDILSAEAVKLGTKMNISCAVDAKDAPAEENQAAKAQPQGENGSGGLPTSQGDDSNI